MADPLILTALLDDISFTRFEAARQKYYPPAQNRVPAHLTLFHNLPSDALDEITAQLQSLCAGHTPMTAVITGLRFLGKGSAYVADCPPLITLHKQLANLWDEWLIPQDRQKFRPHIVIQNKAEPTAARALYETLQAEFQPFTASIIGLQLFHYRNGPWEEAGKFTFVGIAPTANHIA